MIFEQALTLGADTLKRAEVENPRLEARLLLAHALGVSAVQLLRERPDVAAGPFQALVARRAAHEPMALILGRQEFWSLEFAVSGVTLVPRPDSETLIEAAMASLPDVGRVSRILDLGTGTGCLLLAALTEFPAAFGTGVDRVPAAAELARANARALGLSHRSAFVCADWAAPIGGRFDLLLCNPPYVRTADIAGLMPEVALHEPSGALDGGADGLAAYRLLLRGVSRLLAPDGVAIFEIGAGQASEVAALAEVAGLAWSTRDDLAGIPRAIVLRRNPGFAR